MLGLPWWFLVASRLRRELNVKGFVQAVGCVLAAGKAICEARAIKTV